jgi:CRP-like cAMP-binding protein
MEERERQLNKLLKQFHPGNIIFREGEHSNELFILKTGKVAVILNGEKIAEITESGMYLGEMSALLGEPRTATLQAETFCQFYVIPGDRLFKLVLDNPTIGIKLLGIMADRLKTSNQNLVLKDKESATYKEKLEHLRRHYAATMHLVGKNSRMLGDGVTKSIVDYANRIEPIGDIRMDFYDRGLLTDELKKLLKL